MQPRSFCLDLRTLLIESMTSSTNSSDQWGSHWRVQVSPGTKPLRRGCVPEHRRESARYAGGCVVVEVVAGAVPGGWKSYPTGRSPGPADGATTRAETGRPPAARYCRSRVGSTGPSVVVWGLRRFRK